MAIKQLTIVEKRLNLVLTWIAWSFVSLALLAMLWFYFFNRNYSSTNDAQIKQYITPISSKVSGYIKQLYFKENQYVHQGDTLLIIDNRELKEDVSIAQASLKAAQSTLLSQNKIVDSRSSDIPIILANIEAAQVEVWRTSQDYKRFENLLQQQAATLQQFEQMEAKYKLAQAKLKALEEQKNAIDKSIIAEEAKLAPVENLAQQHSGNLNKAKINFSYSYVLAPYDGWVGAKNVQVGQLVKEGQTLVQMVSKEKWIVANFKEKQLKDIQPAARVEVEADAYPDLKFHGQVESFSPASGSEFSLIKPNNATGNFVKIEQRFPVRILLEEDPNLDKLMSGMNVIVSVKIN